MHTTMKDSLNHLFQERFQGHEAPVDPALWQVIEARLLTSAPPTDSVNELFRDRFEDHHVDVDPSVWQGISSQLGHGAASGGLLGGFGWVAAGIAGVLVTGAVLWSIQEPSLETTTPTVAEVVQQAPLETQEPRLNAAPEASLTDNQAATTEPEVVERYSENVRRQASPNVRNILAAAEDETAVATPGETLSAPRDSNPELVEGIISDIAERVRQDVANSRHMLKPPPDAANNPPPVQPQVGAQPDELPAREEVKLYMPNVFTPNGDVQNETYRIEPKTGWLRTLVRVYSMKTNQLVFSTNNLNDEWTGVNCEDGYYLVAVELTTMDERVVSKGQVVWLNRNSMN